jgi:protein-tyrosine phosphatase
MGQILNKNNKLKHIKVDSDPNNFKGYPKIVKYVNKVISNIKTQNKKNEKKFDEVTKEKYKNEINIAVGPQVMIDSTFVTEDKKLKVKLRENEFDLEFVCEPKSRNNLANFEGMINVENSNKITIIRMLADVEKENNNGFRLGEWLQKFKDCDKLLDHQWTFDDDLTLDGEEINSIIDEMASKIIDAITEKHNILIACKAGQSRSTAVTLAIYALLDNKEAAIQLCKQSIVMPNSVICMKLIESFSNMKYKIPEWFFNYSQHKDYGLHETGKFKILN